MRSRGQLFWAVAVFALACWGCSRSPGSMPAQAKTAGPDFVRSDLSRPLRLVICGDTRFTDPSETSATNPKVRRWLVEEIAAQNPDAILVTGDLPWHGGVAGDYDEYRAETKIWRDAHLSVYPALGNHEFAGRERRCLENWWQTFPELRGLRWYSVQLSNSIYLLSLDSNSALVPGSPQIEWLRLQLRNLPAAVRFVFFILHHPPVLDVQAHGDVGEHNGRPNEFALAEFLAQAPEKARVSFVVASGHIHNYERFFREGIVYVVSGGGGASPRPVMRTPADLYQDPGFPNYHFLRFVEEGNRLVATMFRVANPDAATPSWEEKDHFEVQPAAPASAVSVSRGRTTEQFPRGSP